MGDAASHERDCCLEGSQRTCNGCSVLVLPTRTNFDKTWRLWDVNTGAELLLQEGHSRSVYGLAFQQDGALAASSGLDALARVWDLGTGRSILVFQGHIKPVRLVFCSLCPLPQAKAIIY
ncbi:unnamed protein product [Microthlaspi erraticum]|uniref:Uncharacterized protein n=1 Tax=Microthlaspi erraticum TaxID=1685480 RepID=A0A6D2KJN5_9BRAS|nr:unnamed protein product [Microthlaspi erraticum]